jgi:small subunit ribosomal protein S4
MQLREKQKVKSMYGMLESQFRLFFEKAEKQKGVTGENLLVMLERRLDNTVFRIGFASSRNQARQLVRHNHILVNGRKVNIPSFLVSVGDVISLKEKSRANALINENFEAVIRRGMPSWIDLDKDNYKATMKTLPNREEVTMPIQERLIVELYSK